MSVAEGRSPRSPTNFCAQAADLVRVRSLSCTRNARSRHFRQKNKYVLAQFPSDSLPGLLWPRCLPNVSQRMPPRCLSDASQMPLRCLQMLPRCLPMLPQKNCLRSRAGVILFFAYKLRLLWDGLSDTAPGVLPHTCSQRFVEYWGQL